MMVFMFKRFVQALKATLAMANGLSDPKFDPSVSSTITNMLR